MRPVPTGARGSFTMVVTAEHLANRFKDATLPPVLATPVMIMAMENAALEAIKRTTKYLKVLGSFPVSISQGEGSKPSASSSG